MIKKEYLVQINIIEGRNLRGESNTVDPFVKISVGNLYPQVTTIAKSNATPVWNQSFTFSGVNFVLIFKPNI